MDESKLIGASDGLEEGGKGLRFDVKKVNHHGSRQQGDESQQGQMNVEPGVHDEIIPAFVVRFDYQFFAYLNRCGHIAVQLDFMPGEFFSDDGQTLICATHGAEYAPDTGACLGGPCFGVGLEPIAIREQDGQLFLDSDDYQLVAKTEVN
ncbi:MAG: Rieske 2Fe-2S domain-containing protein [Pseudomonadota bacterium]